MANWLQSRQVRAGGYSGVYTLVVILILVACNWLANQYNKTYDATEAKLYSLSDQTTNIIEQLPEDVTIYYFDRRMEFERPDMNGVSPRASLTRYENASSKVSVEYIDPDADPARSEAFQIRSYGTLVVEMAGRREEANSASEEDVTNALMKLLKSEEKTACVLSGHGEASLDDQDSLGFANARRAIENANYAVQEISLLQSPEIPAECALVIVPGPDQGLLEQEVAILGSYVEGGGRLLLAIDHNRSPELVDLVAEWGIEVRDDLVIDASTIGRLFGSQPVVPLASNYEPHPITEPMRTASLFPLTRSVAAMPSPPEGWTVDELVSTGAGSLATTEYEQEELQLDPERDRQGPISVAVAGVYDVPEGAAPPTPETEDGEAPAETEPEELEARVVVVGTSRFARNAYIDAVGNLDLFLNMVNWLASDEELISIRPKDPASTPMELTAAQMRWLFLGLMLGIPGVIVIAGVRTWWLRR